MLDVAARRLVRRLVLVLMQVMGMCRAVGCLSQLGLRVETSAPGKLGTAVLESGWSSLAGGRPEVQHGRACTCTCTVTYGAWSEPYVHCA